MPIPIKNRRYQGYSTNVGDGLTTLFDSALVAQDLTNVFNMRKGESLVDPSQGSIAWDMLFEPATQTTFNIIQQDCMIIFDKEPRVKVQAISVTGSTDPTNPGFILQAQLLYIGQTVVQTFTFNFLQNLSANDSGE